VLVCFTAGSSRSTGTTGTGISGDSDSTTTRLVAVVVVLVLVLVPVLKGVGSREGADGWQHANKIQNYISVDLRARIRVKVLLLVLY
jgi:hypothetical protein